MSECFPPVPIYSVTAIIVTMITAVTAKIKDSDSAGEPDRRDAALATFLLIVLAVPFIQLLSMLVTFAFVGRCGATALNADARWLLIFHAATVFLLPAGAACWHWNHSNVGRRLRLADESIPLFFPATR